VTKKEKDMTTIAMSIRGKRTTRYDP